MSALKKLFASDMEWNEAWRVEYGKRRLGLVLKWCRVVLGDF